MKNYSKFKSLNIFFILILFIFSAFNIFSENSTSQFYKNKPLKIFFQFGPTSTINLAPKNISSPSPIKPNLAFTTEINMVKNFSIAPTINFFTNYYLWYDGEDSPKNSGAALFAEIEHRTALVFNFLIDIPLVYNVKIKKSNLGLGLGCGILGRFGILSSGVSENEKTDVELINKYFWGKARFVYPMFQISWDYLRDNNWSLGGILKAYLPLGSILDQSYGVFHNSIICLCFRVGF